MHSQRIEVFFDDGRVFLCDVVASDKKADIGLLKIRANATGSTPGQLPELPYLRPGRAHSLKPGEWVSVLGAPLGGLLTVSAGAQARRCRRDRSARACVRVRVCVCVLRVCAVVAQRCRKACLWCNVFNRRHLCEHDVRDRRSYDRSAFVSCC